MNIRDVITDNEINYLSRQLLAKYRERLTNDGINATGNLASTADYEIKVEGTNVVVYWKLQEYWKFVEYGRQPGGNFPPPDKIENWIRVKPIVPRANSNGKIPSVKQLVYLISRKIVREGITPKNTISLTLRENNDLIVGMMNRIAEMLQVNILNEINTL